MTKKKINTQSNFKTSYIIPKDEFDKMKDIAKKRKSNKKQVKKKEKKPLLKDIDLKKKPYTWKLIAKMAIEERINELKEKEKGKILKVPGSTPTLRQARFLKEMRGDIDGKSWINKRENQQQTKMTDYFQSKTYFKLPLHITNQGELLLSFIK